MPAVPPVPDRSQGRSLGRSLARSLRRPLVAILVAALALLGSVAPVSTAAAAPAASKLVLSGPRYADAGTDVEVVAVLTSNGSPVRGAPVALERHDGAAGFVTVAHGTTGARGRIVLQATTHPDPRVVTRLRATFAGDAAHGASRDVHSVSEPESTTTLALSAPARGFVDARVTVTATLVRDDTGRPAAGEAVEVQRRVNGSWRVLVRRQTDGDGQVPAELTVRPDAADNRVRAVFAGTAWLRPSRSAASTVDPRRRATVLRIGGPDRVVDETAVTLRFSWRTRGGKPVPGRARVQRRVGGRWRAVERVALGDDGRARLRVAPRDDTRYRLVGRGGRWWQGDTSGVHALDNLPPTAPVDYPAAAPRPRIKLPRQARATGSGPNAVVSRIPDSVWRSMSGRSWHRGCPVGRSELRLVRVNYWGYDGYRYRGEIVVRDDIVGKTIGAFGDLYRARLPVRSMYRVDRFGWSDYLHGGDNYGSMAAGNTSGFNCRGVVGNPGVPSPHSYGRAIDLNTWENPYHSRRGWTPNSWWAARSHPRIAWRSGNHPVVRIMRANGFRWTYGTVDGQHFDG